MLQTILKLPLKFFVLLLLLLCMTIQVLTRVAMNVSSSLIGLLMLFLLGCGIYMAAKQQWNQVLLLFLLEVMCMAAVLAAAWLIGLLGSLSEALMELLYI